MDSHLTQLQHDVDRDPSDSGARMRLQNYKKRVGKLDLKHIVVESLGYNFNILPSKPGFIYGIKAFTVNTPPTSISGSFAFGEYGHSGQQINISSTYQLNVGESLDKDFGDRTITTNRPGSPLMMFGSPTGDSSMDLWYYEIRKSPVEYDNEISNKVV